MRTFDGEIEGPYTVTKNLTLRGMIKGDATVASDSSLLLYGMVTGDLHVEQGATASIKGTVSGSVTNRGRVEIEGRIVGALRDLDDGQSVVHTGADIRNES